MPDTRDEAVALDAADPLAGWRDEFLIADPDVAYLDGSSLGMMPLRTIERVEALMRDEWAGGLIGSWDHWLELPQRVGDELAVIIGAGPGEVVVHDSVTINLYQLVHAALVLRPDRRVIAIAASEFPTDRYVVDGIARSQGCEVRHGFERLDDVAVAVRSLVDYRMAELRDLVAETARAEAAGALMIWDLSHAVGLLPVDLHGAGVEMAVGCTYKYLNGGPGAPGFSYVAAHLIDQIDQPIWGWFGQVDQFTMGPEYVPRRDVGRLLIGTPGIIGLTAARSGIELSAAAGIVEIAAKARALTAYGLARCEALGLDCPGPTDPARRGGHFSVRHPDAASITRVLAADHGVIADFREPDLVRLGCSPLTTRFTDVHDGTLAIARLTAP
ncbi:MAG TPA: aminotransferase class V-fold PLP-dependent enzyme [Ilumatobacteraceae bacterium]|nr:aminotransferase class V-fold PLP-dependent enzyme [Ilumatobacteraceae bacterium]